MARRHLQFAAALCATSPATTRAQARPDPPPALEWSAPPECPGRDAVLATVARLRAGAGRAPRARAVVRRTGAGRWALHLSTEGPRGASERDLAAGSCAELADAAALILALAVGAAPAGVPQAPAPPEPAPRGPPLRFALRPLVALDVSALPAPAVGVGLALAVLRGRLRVEASVTYWAPRAALVAGNAGGDIGLVAAGLRGCVALLRGAVEPGLCGGVEGGVMTGEGVGVARPASGASAWWALLGGASLAWNLSPLVALRAAVEAGAALSAPDFVLDDVGLVHRPSAWLLRATAGVELRFP